MKILNLSLPLSLVLLAPFAGGCVIVSNTTDASTESASSTSTASDSDADTEASATSTSTASSDSDAGSDSDSSTTATATSTTTVTTSGSTTDDSETDSDTGETTSSTGTTGGGDALLESCDAACMTLIDCGNEQFGTLPECIDQCITGSTPEDPDNAACQMALIDLNLCVAATACDQFEDPELCNAENEAIDLACGGGECSTGAGGNQEGTECSFTEECPEYEHELLCTPEGCSCYEDGELTEECMPQMNICQDFVPETLEDYASECCGW